VLTVVVLICLELLLLGKFLLCTGCECRFMYILETACRYWFQERRLSFFHC